MLDRRKSPPQCVLGYHHHPPPPRPPLQKKKTQSPPQDAHYGPVMIEVDENIRNSKKVYENVLVEIK